MTRLIVLTLLMLNLLACAQPQVSLSNNAANVQTTDTVNSSDQTDIDDLSPYYGFGEMEIIKLDWNISNLQITDLNGDGRNDLAVVNNRKAKIELLIQREAIGPAEKSAVVDLDDIDVNEINLPTRFDKHDIGVSQRISALVTGDLNSDGMMDLAFYGEPPKALYTILQKTDQAQTSKSIRFNPKEKIKIDDGLAFSKALVCADMNGDHRDDLILAGRDAVYVVLQKEDATLAEPVKYPTTSQTLGVQAGDLNGDDRADLILITADNDKSIHTRFGLETGHLGPQTRFFIEKPKPYTVTIADYDGTGQDEILTVEAASERLSCYKFTAEKQTDSRDWPILFYPLESGKENTKRDLVLGDFDGDGLADVVISDPAAAELIFYKQIAGIGLTEPVRFPAFADITTLSAGDINADGKDELAVLSLKEKAMGISEFADDRLAFPQPIDLAGEPLAMDLADVDSDGNLDCLYIFKDPNDIRSLAVIHNPQLLGQTPVKQQDKPSTLQKKRKSTLQLKKLLSNPDGLKTVDVDQDGLVDCLIFVKYEPPILVRQVQKGRFEVIDSPKSQASLIKDASAISIAVADINPPQSGKELLIAQQNFARSLVFSEDQKWKIIDQYNAKSTENKVSAVGAFNIDSNHKPEILLLDGQKGELQILTAQTDGTYRLKKQIEPGKWNIKKMLFAALTGGSDESILLFDGDKFALITPPTAAGALKLEQQFSYETKIKQGRYGQLTAGDINSDGRIDIIIVEYKRNHIEILALDDDFKPTPALRFKVFEEKTYRDARRRESPVEPRQLAVVDVTGDGKPDLVTIIHDRVIIYPQD